MKTITLNTETVFILNCLLEEGLPRIFLANSDEYINFKNYKLGTKYCIRRFDFLLLLTFSI